jgi:hypothetical protein
MAVKRYSTRNEAVFSPSAVKWPVTTGLDEYRGNYAIRRVAPLIVSKLATGFKLTQGACELAEVPKQLF